MGSVLIKDTTVEQRRKIVEDAINSWSDGECDSSDGLGIDYDLYIDGKKELRELNEEYRANVIKAMNGPSLEQQGCCWEK